ncbi:MAG: ribonuclease D [Pseudomonadales bacterium]
MEYHYISDGQGLTAMLDACRGRPVIAIDTEFARFNTYYPMIGLLQIGIGSDNYLVDPLVIEDLTGLRDLMLAPQTLKVLHSGSEDMEVFQHWLGCVPSPVFDTQIAAGMVGIGYALSYQKLVAHFLKIDVPKGETRSDWLARPLRQSQCDYAALDVIHLFEIYPALADELNRLNRYPWALAESAKLTEALPTQAPHALAYQKVKGFAALSQRQLAHLQGICAWREREAQAQNIPKNRVLDGDEVLRLAQLEILSEKDLLASARLSRRTVARYGATLIDLAAEARARPAEALPPKPSADTTPVNKAKLDRLRQVVARQAKALMIAPELLSRRRDLEAIIKSANRGKAALPDFMQGWREAVIGQPLLEAMNK